MHSGKKVSAALLGAALLVGTVDAIASPVIAQTATTQNFDIAAQPLGSALIRFSERTGIQLFFDASLTRGLQSPAVSGALTPSAALGRLLAGSGLTFRFTNATTVTLQREQAASGVPTGQLAPVTVTGRIESPNGPVEGFIAHRSATATKTDTPLLETPQAISVIGREQMQNQNAQSVSDAIHYAPGVTNNAGTIDTRFDTIRVRGFLAPLYLDGLILPSGTTQFGRPRPDPWGLERVEVLRGPSSALYGQIPPGGMLNLVSLRPTADAVHTIELQGSSFGQLQGAVDLGGKISEDGQFLYRLSALAHTGDTQIDHVDDNRIMIQPAFTWRPDKDTSLTLLGQFQRDVNGVATQFLPAQGTIWPNPNGTLPMSTFLGDPNDNSYTRSQFWAGYQFEHRFSDAITFHQNLRYASVDTNLAAVIASSLQANQAVVNRIAYSVPESAYNWTLDNNALFKFSTGPLKHNALVGFDYVYSAGSTKQGIGAAPALNMYQPVYWQTITQPSITTVTGQKQNQYGVYLQDQIAFDHWRLTLSGRNDWVDTLTQNFVTYRNTFQAVSALSGRAGLNYVFDFGLSPYVSFASSFQPTIGTDFSGNPLQPSRGKQYEVGIKYQPDNGEVSANLAAYKLTQTTALTADPNHPGFSLQSGEVTVQGIEADVTAHPVKGLNVTGSYTFTDAKITQSTGADLGSQVATQPQHMASLWGDYTIQEGRLRGLGFGGGIRYIGNSWGNAPNTLFIPDYGLFDAMLSYELGGLNPKMEGAKLVLNANNIADTRYVTTCSNVTGCFYGQSRLITLTMRYQW
jgi:iron complex outermembrane receptor protein